RAKAGNNLLTKEFPVRRLPPPRKFIVGRKLVRALTADKGPRLNFRDQFSGRPKTEFGRLLRPPEFFVFLGLDRQWDFGLPRSTPMTQQTIDGVPHGIGDVWALVPLQFGGALDILDDPHNYFRQHDDVRARMVEFQQGLLQVKLSFLRQ